MNAMNNTNINELAQQLRDAAKTSLSAPEFGSSDVAGITRLRLMKPFVDLSRPKNILAILDDLEAAQQYAKSRDEENQDLMLTVGRLRVEREQLEASQLANWEGREFETPAGWINELLCLAEHSDKIPNRARDAMRVIANGLRTTLPQPVVSAFKSGYSAGHSRGVNIGRLYGIDDGYLVAAHQALNEYIAAPALQEG